MKKINFSGLILLITILSNCIKPGDNISSFTSVPAIVRYDPLQANTIKLVTPVGTLVAPDLKNHSILNYGDALMTAFNVNFDKQPSASYTTVQDFEWFIINAADLQATENGDSPTGEFDAAINNLTPYSIFEDILFVFFSHTPSSDKPYFYEVTYAENTEGLPVMYFRAKKTDQTEMSKYTALNAVAVDIGDFLSIYKNNNRVKFNIMFKTGEKTGENGDMEDVFKAYEDNPVTVQFSDN